MVYSEISDEYIEDDVEMDLKEIISLLISRMWLIILGGIVFGVLAFLISRYGITPMYKSSTQIYVMNKEEDASISYSDLQLGSQLTNDFMTLIKSRPVTQSVIDSINLTMTASALADRITVENPNNTRVLTITVENSNPNTAKLITDEIRDAAAEQIKRVMGINHVNIVEEANIPTNPSSPNVMMNTFIGIVLGGFLMVFIVFIRYMLDDNIKTTDDIEKHLGITVLTIIPKRSE